MKQFFIMAIYFAIVLTIYTPAIYAAGSSNYKVPEIIIPYNEAVLLDKIVSGVDQAPNKDLWNKFMTKNGGWNVLISRSTGTPVAAFGKGIQITGVSEINEKNIHAAAEGFISEFSDILGSTNSELKFISYRYLDGHWYISYSQSAEGMDVIGGRLDLRIFKNGKVSAFFSKLYPNVKPQSGRLNTKQAEEISLNGLNLSGKIYKIDCDSKQCIFPIENSTSIFYVPVYQVYIRVYGEPKHYLVYVDAEHGTILRRVNLITDVLTTGNLKGIIKMRNSLEQDTVVDFYGCYLNSGINKIITQNDGDFEMDLLGNTTYKLNFDSYYGKLSSQSGKAISEPAFTILAGNDNPLLLDDNNSHIIERTLFYHMNKIHTFYKELDTNVAVPDRKTYLKLYWDFTMDNAYSDMDTIAFLNLNSKKMNLGLTPQVVYHEYGHSYVNLLYNELSNGKISGLLNSAIHEGLADLSAATASNEPKIGIGAFVGYPDSTFRNLENTIHYPEGMQGESHYDGQVISGAYWDLRKAVSLDYVNHIVQKVKYGMPDDMNTGLAFYKFFVETIIADDDDGDFDNGTPHDEAIITSFDNHGIGMELYTKLNFYHQQLVRNISAGELYKIDFSLNMSKLKPYEFTDISVIYSKDGFATANKIPATKISDGKYTASIPSLQSGDFINYYFTAIHPISGKVLQFTRSWEDSSTYFYSVNYENTYHLNSDYAQWIVGAPEDNAYTGEWQWAIPNYVSNDGYLIQPNGNCKSEPQPCFITGICPDSTPHALLNGFPDGTTSIISPTFSLAISQKHYIDFSSFYSEYGYPLQENHFYLYISNDNGTSWTNIADLTHNYYSWYESGIPINDYLGGAGKVKFKFVLQKGPLDPSFPLELMSKCIFDNFNIMSSKPPLSVNATDDANIEIGPNPFNDLLTLKFGNSSFSNLKAVEIIDIQGNSIYRFDNVTTPTIVWNGKNYFGNEVPTGIYLLKLTMNSGIRTYKLIRD